MRKKLNLLKPNLNTAYLRNGRGQEVNYIDLTDGIDRKALENDVKNGGKQFAALMDFTNKKPSQFVVINCDHLEDGLMAASYLAGIYNQIDKVDMSLPDEELYDMREFDFDEEDYDFYELDEVDPWEEDDMWEETPFRIPVIDSDEMADPSNQNFFSMANDHLFSNGARRNGNIPFWYYTRREPIIITLKRNRDWDCLGTGFGFAGYGGKEGRLINACKRYLKNRHVYIVRECRGNAECEALPEGNIQIETLIDERETAENNELMEFVLEYSAGILDVFMGKADRTAYLETVMRNMLANHDYRTSKNFPMKKLIKMVQDYKNPSKNALMEKIVKYLEKEERDTNVITEKDIEFMKAFAHAGVREEDKKWLQKMQKELVGMDSVKKQMKGIVEVMKYNKRRQDMGLGSGTFHNVHMLLGAPGTAKTTVAEMLGKMMAEERLLPGSRFISINGAELKGMFVGQTAPKVKALFDQHEIIMIDEAYSVASSMEGEMDTYGQEAIAQLIIELEKHGQDRLVIFAGYGGKKVSEKDNKMKEFLNANPGIRSRINSTIYFDSYSSQEMLDILLCHAKKHNYHLNKDTYKFVLDFFEKRAQEKDFGNGREARSLLENITVEAARRLADVPEDELNAQMMQELTVEDVKGAITRMTEAHETQRGRESLHYGFMR